MSGIASGKISKSLMALVLGISLTTTTLALADWGRGQAAPHHVSHHYYRNGHWYHHGWFGTEVAVPSLSAGVYVNTLPPAYSPVVVNGATYYYGDNTYFSPADGGYMVVSAPR